MNTKKIIGLLLSFLVLMGWTNIAYSQFNMNYFEQGRYEFTQKNYTEAIRLLSYALERDDDIPDAWFYRGISKYFIGDNIGAEKDFTACIQRAPYHKNARMYRAIVRNRMQNFEQAFRDFEKAIEIAPNDPYIYLQRATAYLTLNQLKKAVSDCNKAIKLSIDEISVYTVRGAAYAELEQFESAMQDFDFVLKNDPSNLFTLVQKGQTYLKMEIPDSAMICYNQVLAIDSTDALALYRRALLQFENQAYKLALTDINKILQANHENHSARFTQAVIYSQLEEIPKAIEDYSEILKKIPDNILTLYNRAGLYAASEMWEAAEQDYSKAISLFPDYADAYRNRSLVRLKLGDKAAAERDQIMAKSINQMNTLKSEKLKHDQSVKLQKLTSLDSDFSQTDDDMLKANIQSETAFIFIPETMEISKSFTDVSKIKGYKISTFALSNQFETLTPTVLQNSIDSLSQLLEKEINQINLIRRGCLYSIQNNFNKAMDDFASAEKINDKNPLLHFCKGSTYLMLGQFLNELNAQNNTIIGMDSKTQTETALESTNPDFVKAIEAFDKAIQLDESAAFVYFNRAITHGLMGNHRSAINDYGKSIKYRKKFAEAYYNRGLSFIYTGKNTYGCEDMGTAGELGKTEAYSVIKIYCN
ncbi:MAG: tetratricopeptide repeat protein [Bacteroidales bacterium]|nr:tetratricopeptide repeat protein [Bacteroidales bacterium]